MAIKEGLLDEHAMAELARRALVAVRKKGVLSVELDRLEKSLVKGNVGEAYILFGILEAVINELSPDAPQKKLMHIYQGVEHSCYFLAELSRNLYDIEVWRHYKASGYETFDSYCVGLLEITPAKIEPLKLLKDHPLPRPGRPKLSQLFFWLFEAAGIMAGKEGTFKRTVEERGS